MTRMVQCIKLGKEAPGMKFAPLPNELGKRIFDNVSQEAWDAWTRHQTMLINENRLSLADPRARQYLALLDRTVVERHHQCRLLPLFRHGGNEIIFIAARERDGSGLDQGSQG